VNARFKILEIVSTNVKWLKDKEEEINDAFGRPRGSKSNPNKIVKIESNFKPNFNSDTQKKIKELHEKFRQEKLLP
jgi:hypothetical protein